MRMRQYKTSQNIRKEDEWLAPYDYPRPNMGTLWNPLGSLCGLCVPLSILNIPPAGPKWHPLAPIVSFDSKWPSLVPFDTLKKLWYF